ncbi:VanZ family protein [Robertkochia marina]|uniref:VanZ family protein n=1 Tax=Robertkochia marina TaxID=1227945 RepID=UPI001454C325|nr:VanZ family protein [Robertkochia marina]
MLKRLKFLLAASLWLLSVAVASLISANYLPDVEVDVTYLDKLVHAAFYMVATFLLYLHFRNSQQPRILLKIAMFCFGYGMIIEVLQYALPYNRGFEWADMMANGFGILLAIMLIKFVLSPAGQGKGKF